MSQHTATDEDRRPRQAYWGNQESASEFCDYHGLHMSFLPLRSRRKPVWGQLQKIRKNIPTIRETKQHFKIQDVLPNPKSGSYDAIEDLLWACGSYRAGKQRSVNWWANPNYVHGDEHITPRADLETHIQRAMDIPFVTLADIAPRFGKTTGAMHDYVYRHDIEFQPQQTARKLDIGRSIRCGVEWTGTTVEEYARRLPAPLQTVRDWVHAVDDFAVPDYPNYSRFHKQPQYREER